MQTRKIIKFIAVILLCFFAITLIYNNNSYAGIKTPSELEARLNELRNTAGYREGDTFGGSFSGAIQCHGWALKLTNALFGSDANSSNLWTDTPYPSVTADDLCIGDIVRYNCGTYEHSIVVINIVGDRVYYADCNWGENCDYCTHSWWGNSICWNRSMTKSEINSKLNAKCVEPGHEGQNGRIIHHSQNDVKSFEEKPNLANLGDSFTATMVFKKDKTGNTVISADGTKANSNVEISKRSDELKENQIWKFERQSDGSYYIKNTASDLYLDVDNEETENGTNIKLYNYSASNAQKWCIIAVKTGGYRLIPKHCYDLGIKRGLDIDAGGTEEGTNVHLWEYLEGADEDTGNQVIDIKKAFYCKFEDLGENFTAAMIYKKDESGDAVVSAKGNTKGSNVEISKKDGALEENQLWNFERQSDGSYYIKNVASDLYLDVDNEETSNGTNIKIWEYSKATAQKWYIVKVDERYRLVPKHCYDAGVRSCLDIDAGGTKEGTNVHLWEFLHEANDYGKTQVIYIEKEEMLKGDVNQDGIVDMLDYVLILSHVRGTKLLTGDQLDLADVNEDGVVDMLDYVLVLSHVRGTKSLN